MKALLVALLLLPLPVLAQYKCVSDGRTIYSARPCPPGTRADRAAETPSDLNEKKIERPTQEKPTHNLADESEGMSLTKSIAADQLRRKKQQKKAEAEWSSQ